jgi:hypothetical protein
VVGTPAKVLDLMEKGLLDLSLIHFFILDEADRLIDPDSLPMVLKLFNACPNYGRGEHRLQVRSLYRALSIKWATPDHMGWAWLIGCCVGLLLLRHAALPWNHAISRQHL